MLPVALLVDDDVRVAEPVAEDDGDPPDEPGGGGLGSDGSSGALKVASEVGNSPDVESLGPPSSPAVPEYLTLVVVLRPKNEVHR